MKDTTMFLTVLVPGPENPKAKLDVFLQPLIAELKHLWDVSVHAYDISLKQNFQLRAALMWTIVIFLHIQCSRGIARQEIWYVLIARFTWTHFTCQRVERFHVLITIENSCIEIIRIDGIGMDFAKILW